TGSRLRERGRHGGMEGDVALNLLHHLVDVAIEHSHRAEPLQELESARAIVGAPAPLLEHGPQRDMREHHDRRLGGFSLEIVREPLELILAEIAEAAGLQIDHINEADEMHAVGIEAVPSSPLGILAVALAIELRLLVDEVMLARHVMHVERRLRDDAVGIVELGGFRQMRDVPGVDHECGFYWERLDLADRLLERADHIRIGGLVGAALAGADLQEGELASLGGEGAVNDPERAWHAARDRPQYPGSGPGHAF